MSALGEEFRSAREARSLSLADVAERLHIRTLYLAAIEEEDWNLIGAPVYARGFIRTYARFLGLDGEDAVARYSASVPAAPPPASVPRPAAGAVGANERRGSGDGTNPSLAAILAIVAAVLAVAFVGYEFYQYRAGTSGAAPLAQSSASASAAEAPPAAPTPGSASATGSPAGIAVQAAPGSPAPPKPGLTLQVTEASWLRVTVDDTVVFEGTLPAGTTKSFLGKNADVRVGNAGGVKIAINGKALGSLGASGDVVERRFALSGE